MVVDGGHSWHSLFMGANSYAKEKQLYLRFDDGESIDAVETHFHADFIGFEYKSRKSRTTRGKTMPLTGAESACDMYDSKRYGRKCV